MNNILIVTDDLPAALAWAQPHVKEGGEIVMMDNDTPTTFVDEDKIYIIQVDAETSKKFAGKYPFPDRKQRWFQAVVFCTNGIAEKYFCSIAMPHFKIVKIIAGGHDVELDNI